MSKSILANRSRINAATGRGFSATELIIVIAILTVLGAMVIGAVSVANRHAGAARIRADLQAVSTALEQYYSDFGIYPGMSSDTITQRQILAKALIGPGDVKDDGFNGPGFCTVPGGKAWEPYLPSDKFQVKNLSTNSVSRWVLMDHLGNVIRYFPKLRNFSPTLGSSVAGNADAHPRTIYEMDDAENNLFATTPKNLRLTVSTLRIVLGDVNLSNSIDGNETFRCTSGYILASPGIDGEFTAADNNTLYPTTADKVKAVMNSDDIYNFDYK